MNRYSFDSIAINGREIRLGDILENAAEPRSRFEASTFLFIQKWFGSDDAFLQNTSGSTGTPKGILITRSQMITSAKLTAQALELRAGESALLCLDPEYIAGKMMLVRSLVMNMKIVAVEPAANPFSALLKHIQVDFAAIVPMQLQEILHSGQNFRLDSIRNILVGGAALDYDTRKELSKYHGRVYATYGMTETVSHIALQPLNGPDASDCFNVLPGITVRTDDRGCLQIEAPHLGGTIVTNDIVEIIDSNRFKWLGRSDNIINSGGIKVIPEKIENQIHMIFSQHGVKNKFLISSVSDRVLGRKIILLTEGDLPTGFLETLRSVLGKILPRFEVPKEIRTNIKFILTENGKINRSETSRQIGN